MRLAYIPREYDYAARCAKYPSSSLTAAPPSPAERHASLVYLRDQWTVAERSLAGSSGGHTGVNACVGWREARLA